MFKPVQMRTMDLVAAFGPAYAYTAICGKSITITMTDLNQLKISVPQEENKVVERTIPNTEGEAKTVISAEFKPKDVFKAITHVWSMSATCEVDMDTTTGKLRFLYEETDGTKIRLGTRPIEGSIRPLHRRVYAKVSRLASYFDKASRPMMIK